jgi:5-formyltetrahydrofolate cyclo-ligase
MLPPIAPLLNPKRILRERMKAERRAAIRPDAGRHAARIFMDSIPLPENAVVSLYHPIGEELDTGPLLDALLEKGATIVLPIVEKKRRPLVFRRYIPGDALVAGVYGALTPKPDAPVMAPDIVVAPLLAFTRNGGRLGYGGGYYDRTLAVLRKEKGILAIGFAYGAQEVDALPLSPLDQPLDWVVTEREAIRCA